jgi:hypothetical protein
MALANGEGTVVDPREHRTSPRHQVTMQLSVGTDGGDPRGAGHTSPDSPHRSADGMTIILV